MSLNSQCTFDKELNDALTIIDIYMKYASGNIVVRIKYFLQ